MNARFGDLGKRFTSQNQCGTMERPVGASHLPGQPNRNGSYEDHVMASKALPSPEVLRQLLRYEPETGKLFWLPRGPEWFRDNYRMKAEHFCKRWNNAYSGKEAGYHHGRGYLSLNILNEKHKAHRVAWAIYHGYWPNGHIDHINHQASDNRIVNLRDVTQAENNKNRPPQSNSCTFVGVYKHQSCNRWVASIGHQGKQVYLGLFACVGLAIKARRDAERRFGFHAGHGGVA